jgi:serine/threonine-protein kinase
VCLGKPVDQRSDIFSLGIVLFECLAGRMPFTDESPLGLMLEVVKAEIPDVCTLNSEVDAELSRVLTRMIAKDPAERYQSCHELVADLGQHPLVARGGPITLQTKMTTAAATMIGQKTPVSGQQSLPSTTPTPRPMPAVGSVTPRPASATTAARAAPDLRAGAPVRSRERGAAPKRSALPLAIAAIAFLLLVSAAWAFRDRSPHSWRSGFRRKSPRRRQQPRLRQRRLRRHRRRLRHRPPRLRRRHRSPRRTAPSLQRTRRTLR